MTIPKISKIHTFIVVIMMMAILLCCSSQVQGAQSGDYTYTVTDGKAEITKYTGAGGVVTIPNTLGEFPVTSIGNLAFLFCKDLTSISIPQGVSSIGREAFSHCTGLTTISIPSGVTIICESTFSNCTGLKTIIIPPGVTSIGKGAFYDCTGLTSISLPQGVTFIGDWAFDGCRGLTSISLPQGVTSIGDQAFGNCTGLTSITVAVDNLRYASKDGVLFNKAGTNLIACPGGLTSIIIPVGVTSIGYWAFDGCRGLTSISIPEGVTSIDDCAFYGCTALSTVRFNSATTSIYDMYSTIPDTTKIIGYDPSTAKDYATKYNRTFEVIGTTNILQSIAITTPASKLSYTTGNALDITGLVVTGTYSDGSTKAESITVANITGFNSATAVVDQVLTITVGAETTTFKVQIVAAPQETEFSVLAANDPSQGKWLDTRVHVNKSEYYKITATGRALFDPNLDYTDPDGTLWNSNGVLQNGKRIDQAVLPSAPIGALIGAIKDLQGNISTPFGLGSEVEIQIPSSGQLLLAYNDNPGQYRNNSGVYSVTFEALGANSPDISDIQYLSFSQISYNNFSDAQKGHTITEIAESLSDFVEPIWIDEKKKNWGDLYFSEIGDWKLLKLSDKNNFELVISDGNSNELQTGFYAVAFINENTKDIVISYRGSEKDTLDKFVTDWVATDFNLTLFGGLSEQFKNANDFYIKVKEDIDTDINYKDYKIGLTGHSLGGALASYVSIMNNVDAITFNAPSITVANFTNGAFFVNRDIVKDLRLDLVLKEAKYYEYAKCFFDTLITAEPLKDRFKDVVETYYKEVNYIPFEGYENMMFTDHVNEHDTIVGESGDDWFFGLGWKNIDNTFKHKCLVNDDFLHIHLTAKPHNLNSYLTFENSKFILSNIIPDGVYKTKAEITSVAKHYSNDSIMGDLILGTRRSDKVTSGSWIGINNDYLYGGNGNDELLSYDGNDYLTGGKDDDSLFGGSGNDTYLFNNGDGADRINDNSGNDIIVFAKGILPQDVNISNYDAYIDIQYSNNDHIIVNKPYSIRGIYYSDKSLGSRGKFEVIDTTPDLSEMTEITTTSPIVKPDKVWTIRLNGLVNESSIKDKLYITNSQGLNKQVPTCTVTTANGLSQISVKPAQNYAPGDYMLWVRDIENGKGTKIKNQVYLKFTVQ